jgi:hypothetical protein
MLGNGDGTFRSGAFLPGSFDELIAGDFNQDGKLDLASRFPEQEELAGVSEFC